MSALDLALGMLLNPGAPGLQPQNLDYAREPEQIVQARNFTGVVSFIAWSQVGKFWGMSEVGMLLRRGWTHALLKLEQQLAYQLHSRDQQM